MFTAKVRQPFGAPPVIVLEGAVATVSAVAILGLAVARLAKGGPLIHR